MEVETCLRISQSFKAYCKTERGFYGTVKELLTKVSQGIGAAATEVEMISRAIYTYDWNGRLSFYCRLTIFQMQDQGLSENRTFHHKRYNAQKCIEKYSYMLIRPPRFLYKESLIDPRRKFRGAFEHAVFHIPFPLSLYTPRTIKYVLLYLHGNSSSRYEGYSQLPLLPPDVGLACFDFDGCGNRTQKPFISLGKSECKEADIAVRFLKERGFKVAVWGRSMGAVSGLLSQQAEVVIADSAFASLYGTCKELSKTQVCMPLHCLFQCFFPCFFCVVSRDVQQKSDMHPNDLEIKEHLARSNRNRHILFLAAMDDKMIHYSHSQTLYDSFPGANKKLILFEGTHNSDRPNTVLSQIFAFAEASLLQEDSKHPCLVDSKRAELDSHEYLKPNQTIGNEGRSEIEMPQLGMASKQDNTELVQLRSQL